MSTKDCGHSTPCGCEDQALTGPPPCAQGTPNCPDPDPCPETFRAECLVWTSDDLICNSTVLATSGDRLPIILERMVALFCGATPVVPAEGFALILPTPNGAITGPDDIEICVDRNNCFEDLVVSVEAGGPAGITFTWLNAAGEYVYDDPTMLIEAGRSCVLFSWDTSSLPPGLNLFNFEITGCGVSYLVPVFYNKL